ncbi:hypothetical protein WI85_28725 [Burkholderia ubonensis]|nr:hypothetical protein WI85_28725 [Burkholderia ubonensis]KVP03263.1 hypothetical protein WJ82_21580 [Burkholderia ubonensis]OJB18916.1 hypothetical protein BGV53_09205 [Burkholderia ubonensis]
MRATGNPISSAERSLPPIAYTLRPKRVKCATWIATNKVASATSAPALSAPPPTGTLTPAIA